MKHGVSLVLLNNQGQVLLSQRLATTHSGYWTGPGGRVEDGEEPFKALLREVQEEAGLDLSRNIIEKLIETEQWSLSNYPYILHGYMTTIRTGQQPKRMEPEKHSDWVWVDVDKALSEYNLLKGVRAVLEEYKKRSTSSSIA